jgi:hypothetical protein
MEVSDVAFLSSLLDFLMSLLRDEDAAQEFERDPQGVLARNGLDGVSGQDVRDVTPMLADHDGVSARHYGSDGGGSGHASRSHHSSSDDDPVREIHAIKNNYVVDNGVVVNNSYNTYNDYDLTYTDDSNTIIDDRDTTITGDDVHYEDNSTTKHTIVEDSFNQDNDGVDNKGGTIDDSIVAGDDVENSGNQDNDTEVTDSFNEDNDTVTVDDSYNEDNDQDNDTLVADGSFNEDNDETTVEIDDTENTAA